jgi:hypothetical protein
MLNMRISSVLIGLFSMFALLAMGCGGIDAEGDGETGDTCDGSGVWATDIKSVSLNCDLSGGFHQDLRVSKGSDGMFIFEATIVGDTNFLGDISGSFTAEGTSCQLRAHRVKDVVTPQGSGTNTTDNDLVADAQKKITGKGTLVQVYTEKGKTSQCDWTLDATGTLNPL